MEFVYAQNVTLIVLFKPLEFLSALEVARRPLRHLVLLTFWSIYILREPKREPDIKLRSKLKTLGHNLTLTHLVNILCTICSVSREV